MRLPSMTDQHPHVDEDLERLAQQSRAVPLGDPKILEEIEDLECEVFQLNRVKDDLEEEIKEQQKIIHNQQQGKRALLQSLREQKEKVDRLQLRQEEMNAEHAQLLAAKDEMIRNLHVTLEELRAQWPHKSPQIPREPCEEEEVGASQPLPRENGSEERDPPKAEIQRLVQGIKEQELEMKLLAEQNIRLTEQVDRLSKEEIGKLTRIIQQKDMEIQHLSSRISEASDSQNRHVEHLQRQLQECALKSEQILAVLNEKTRENSNLRRDYHEMTHRLAAKDADLQRMQEENQKLSTRVESSGQEVARALEGKLKSLQGLLHQTNADLEVKEDQLQEFKKQNEVQREILEDTQKKLLTLVSQAEGMVDKTLLRGLFVGSLQAADAERREALRLMASALGIREDQLRQLRGQEPAGVPSGATGGPESRSAPNSPAKPNHQAVANHSFSELFVQFLKAESHSTFPPPKPSAHDVMPPDSGGRGKLPKKQGPPRLNATLGSTPRKNDVKPRTTAVSLINPPGPEMDGSQHLLLNAVTDALPTYTPQILSPAKKGGKAAKHLSEK
ncbi:thyroid receptor-interacting protein 11-like [Lutra lutra]|uniref:thyroid receptor-interacting protein 11-like n=1 Tax=Lutra lutra TaxID=9657 RepID=UPI001FD3371A|nr:thyroid receptor-interacting protein 11-like [Lutra lutra]